MIVSHKDRKCIVDVFSRSLKHVWHFGIFLFLMWNMLKKKKKKDCFLCSRNKIVYVGFFPNMYHWCFTYTSIEVKLTTKETPQNQRNHYHHHHKNKKTQNKPQTNNPPPRKPEKQTNRNCVEILVNGGHCTTILVRRNFLVKWNKSNIRKRNHAFD